jgi:hypothetical protein
LLKDPKFRLMILLSVLATVVAVANPFTAHSQGTPANKVAASGDDVDTTSEDEAPIRVLSEQVKVSTTHDLMIHVSSECSILTSLFEPGDDAPGASSSQFSFGQVKFFVTIDDQRVPVAINDTDNDPHSTNPDEDDFGEVVFCNRAYQRTLTDAESDQDGIDGYDDFIRTRSANAFNYMALNVGVDDPANANRFENYDNPDNGNNVVDVELWAEFDREPAACATESADNDPAPIGKTCAEAFVGSRTMILETTNASVREEVATDGPGPS